MTDQAEELEFAVHTHGGSHVIRVTPYGGGVWFALGMSGCNVYTHMTKDEAKRLIDAMTTIVEAA